MCHSLITVFWAPRCLEPLSKNEAECQTNFNHHAIKTLFSTRKFLHVASFWNWGCLELGDMSLLPRAYIIIWHNLPEISSPIAKLFGSFGSLKSDFQWISIHRLNEVCIIQVIIQETGLYFFYSFLSFFDIELSISWQFRRGFQARYRHWIFVLNILQLLRNYTKLTF